MRLGKSIQTGSARLIVLPIAPGRDKKNFLLFFAAFYEKKAKKTRYYDRIPQILLGCE
jgi:hypothetical protein